MTGARSGGQIKPTSLVVPLLPGPGLVSRAPSGGEACPQARIPGLVADQPLQRVDPATWRRERSRAPACAGSRALLPGVVVSRGSPGSASVEFRLDPVEPGHRVAERAGVGVGDPQAADWQPDFAHCSHLLTSSCNHRALKLTKRQRISAPKDLWWKNQRIHPA